jgi:hypothetical protein
LGPPFQRHGRIKAETIFALYFSANSKAPRSRSVAVTMLRVWCAVQCADEVFTTAAHFSFPLLLPPLVLRAMNEATRPRRGMSGRDEEGRGATRQAGARRGRPGLGGRCRRGGRGATRWVGVRRARASSGTRAPFTALLVLRFVFFTSVVQSHLRLGMHKSLGNLDEVRSGLAGPRLITLRSASSHLCGPHCTSMRLISPQ